MNTMINWRCNIWNFFTLIPHHFGVINIRFNWIVFISLCQNQVVRYSLRSSNADVISNWISCAEAFQAFFSFFLYFLKLVMPSRGFHLIHSTPSDNEAHLSKQICRLFSSSAYECEARRFKPIEIFIGLNSTNNRIETDEKRVPRSIRLKRFDIVFLFFLFTLIHGKLFIQ